MAEYVEYRSPKGPKIFKVGRYSFSTIELKHLGIAYFMITLTLMALQRGMLSGSNEIDFLSFIIVSFFSVGLGFILHEFGHKLTAQHFGYLSEFRVDFLMLFVAFLIAVFFGFTFLAPGAVMIRGRPSIKQTGKISVAGPLVNLVLGLIFVMLNVIYNPTNGTIFWNVILAGIFVNSFLGIFNMLPFWVLDGKKVLAWSNSIYFTVLFGLIFVFGYLFVGF